MGPTDVSIRNLTCHTDNCIIQCNEEESCQKFQIHGANAQNINLQCDYPEIKELRPGSCWRANIFSQNASNVTVYCTNENCAESKFYINGSVHSQIVFNGDWAGKFAQIYASNIEKNLFVICNDSESCSDISIYCPLNSRSLCSIHCNGTKSCLNANIFGIDSNNFNHLSLDCNSSHSACTNLKFFCLDGTNNTLWFDLIDLEWRCVKESVCCPFKDSQKQHRLVCDDESDCVIDCNVQSCHWSIIDAVNAKSLNLFCRSEEHCIYTAVYCPNNNAAICNIECAGKQSCKFMNVSSLQLNSLNIACDSRSSCQQMTVNVKLNGNANIICRNEWSCANSKFLINGASDGRNKYLKLQCDGRYSCEGIQFYCPYRNEASCLLQCADDDGSCNGVHIIQSNRDYEFNYLQIQCPKQSKSMLKACNFMKISCGDASVKSTVLRFDDNKLPKCNNANCCPWKQEKNDKIIKVIKKKQQIDDDNSKYDTIIAIMCCLITMYLLTSICSMTNNLK